MTHKEAQRRLAAALREQRAVQDEVRRANALVVKETSKLPPHYVYEHLRFVPGEKERIQKLIDRAQRASDRLAIVTADVVNLRRLMLSTSNQHAYKKIPPAPRHHATKKKSSHKKAASSAPLSPPRSRAATVIVYSRPSGYWYAQAHDATNGAQITDASGYSREDVLRELRGKFAMIGVAIKSITSKDPYEVGRLSHHATKKKSPAQLQGEIDAALARPLVQSPHSKDVKGRPLSRTPGRRSHAAMRTRPEITATDWRKLSLAAEREAALARRTGAAVSATRWDSLARTSSETRLTDNDWYWFSRAAARQAREAQRTGDDASAAEWGALAEKAEANA